ncbi:MAG: cupredoxin domain-containing protein [Chthoniobacterales bacterium]
MKTKTFAVMALATAFVGVPWQLRAEDDKTVSEQAAEVWDKTKEKTKEAAGVVVEKTKEAVAAVENAIDKPDADARKVDVTISDRAVQMPPNVDAGETAFVVKNAGKEKHNFEIKGANLEKSFWFAIAPGESKTMELELKPGSYEAGCSLHEKAEPTTKFTVK